VIDVQVAALSIVAGEGFSQRRRHRQNEAKERRSQWVPIVRGDPPPQAAMS